MSIPRLFIDTLNLTIQIPVQERQAVDAWLQESSRFGDWPLNQSNARAGAYGSRYSLTAPNGEIVKIEANPHNPSNAYLRLEYSPEKIGIEGATTLAATLAGCLGSNYREYFYQGTATRLDVTFDLRRIPLRDIWIIDRRTGFKSALIRGKTLDIETIYCGYSTSQTKCYRQLCIYDKVKERQRAGRPSLTSTHWVRFEYRYSKGDYILAELYATLSNPYSHFSIKRYAPIPAHMDATQSRLLFDACRMHGEDNVLALTQETDRERIRLAIEAFPRARFFDRRLAIWLQLRERIHELLPQD